MPAAASSSEGDSDEDDGGGGGGSAAWVDFVPLTEEAAEAAAVQVEEMLFIRAGTKTGKRSVPFSSALFESIPGLPMLLRQNVYSRW
jgi:hypothetical protein